MKLKGIGRSRNIEDRRQVSARGAGVKLGGVGLLVVLAIGYFAGIDVTELLENGPATSSQPRPISAEEQRAADFSASVLGTTETVWTAVFRDQLDRTYQPPILVLFSGQTASPCGGASGATGPFYCPADQKAYLDTAFFATLAHRLGAGGDFAAAYVIAHEVAHHVQGQLGILHAVDQRRQQLNQVEANALTVKLELQADCLAGVWARAVDGLLEPGDLEDALNAARQIADDRLQQAAGQIPQPHTFTHGTAAQRVRWFSLGYQSGVIGDCDTFRANRL